MAPIIEAILELIAIVGVLALTNTDWKENIGFKIEHKAEVESLLFWGSGKAFMESSVANMGLFGEVRVKLKMGR